MVLNRYNLIYFIINIVNDLRTEIQEIIIINI